MSDAVVDLLIINLIEGILSLHLAVELLHISQLVESLLVENTFYLAENGLDRVILRRVR